MPTIPNHKDKEHPVTLRMKIGEKIKKLAPSIEDAIIDIKTDRVVARRASAWVLVDDDLEKLERDFNKIRKKPLGFDDDGKSIGEAPWTKEQMEERKKLQDQINKRVSALNKALDKEEWDDVFQLAGSLSTGKDKSESKEESK